MAIVEGRGADGKFTKGNSGGGRLGTGIDKTARALLKENSEKITKKIIELALEGDATLLKALFDRLIPTQSLAQLLLTEQMIRLEEVRIIMIMNTHSYDREHLLYSRIGSDVFLL